VWANPTLLPSARAKRPSVILVSLDTLRADKVGVYGHASARTPALDQLAAAGVQYQRAYAPSTWTVPSHASLFYGAYLPASPGVLRESQRTPKTAELPDRPISEILRGAGYLTAGFTGGGFLGYPWDFFRGFDTYFSYSQPAGVVDPCSSQRFDGPEVFRRATRWLERNHGAPFFLFVHTYDAHDRCPFFQPDVVRPEGKPFDAAPSLDRADHQQVLDYYDQMIEETDRRLAGLLAAVDALGLRDDTLVIVTSDHGEALFEHGFSAHGCNLKPYEELARVPLLVRFPGRAPAGGRVAAPVSLIDVVPSILALLGLPPEPRIPGGILPGLGLRTAPGPSQPIYNHCGDALAVWRGQHKLITWRDRRESDEIYDLSEDPNERTNLGGGDPNASQLAADADAFWKTAPVQPNTPAENAGKPELDEATRQRLRDLGYLK
jgi:arylsulfatase A-like enzyme